MLSGEDGGRSITARAHFSGDNLPNGRATARSLLGVAHENYVIGLGPAGDRDLLAIARELKREDQTGLKLSQLLRWSTIDRHAPEVVGTIAFVSINNRAAVSAPSQADFAKTS